MIFIFIGLFIVLLCFSILTVEEKTIKVTQLFGKFHKAYNAGLNFRIPFFEWVAGTIDLRIQQLDVQVETKTKDNVFINIMVAVQYYTDPEKAVTSFYKLDNAKKQFTSYVFDTIRSQVPKLNLDDVFEKKEDIAIAVKKELQATMSDFGFEIVTALVTNIDPDTKVKNSMNEINASQRLQVASQAKGEAEKILTVKKAEGEAESKRLQGKGIADERLEIAKGLKESAELIKEAGVSKEHVMDILMLTQYFDTLGKIGSGGKVLFVNSSPSGMTDFRKEIMSAIEGTK